MPAVRSGGIPAAYVNIPPNGTAHSVLGDVDIQIGRECKPVTATFLKVYPPDDVTAPARLLPAARVHGQDAGLVVWRVQPGA